MFKRIIENYAPNIIYSIFASSYWVVHPNKETRLTYPKDGMWVVKTGSETFLTLKGSTRGSKSYQDEKFGRYTNDTFVTVEPNDVIVDVGAFLGEFSIPAAEIGQSVYALEPDPQTFNYLTKRTKQFENITPIQALPSDEDQLLQFNSASDPTESSILDVDKGAYNSVELQAQKLDEILLKAGIDTVDFLKIDAEGAEPEVLCGLQEVEVRKVAIDGGPERYGEPTKKEIIGILETRGYEVRVRDSVVFGVK